MRNVVEQQRCTPQARPAELEGHALIALSELRTSQHQPPWRGPRDCRNIEMPQLRTFLHVAVLLEFSGQLSAQPVSRNATFDIDRRPITGGLRLRLVDLLLFLLCGDSLLCERWQGEQDGGR